MLETIAMAFLLCKTETPWLDWTFPTYAICTCASFWDIWVLDDVKKYFICIYLDSSLTMFVIIKYKAQFSLQNRIQDGKFCIKSELQLFADVNYAALRGKVANDGLIFNSIGWNQVLSTVHTQNSKWIQVHF